MISIGDFSQLGQVSVRTLRHYDELGLLKPAHVDHFTNYLYYSVDQLSRLHRILMLKDLGLSLEQIALLLKQTLSTEQLRGMLMIKQAELKQEILDRQEQLQRVEARFRMIEQEGQLTSYDIVLKKVDSQRIASVVQVVPSIRDMPRYRCACFEAVYCWLEQNRFEHIGPELVLYRNTEYTEQDVDMEVGIVADVADMGTYAPPSEACGEVSLRELPGAFPVASTIHQGPLEDVGQAVVALYTWISENGYSTSGPWREVHLLGKELDRKPFATFTVEIQIPVTKNQD
jgi:DNA-binding transcriptional MerR regulator